MGHVGVRWVGALCEWLAVSQPFSLHFQWVRETYIAATVSEHFFAVSSFRKAAEAQVVVGMFPVSKQVKKSKGMTVISGVI